MIKRMTLLQRHEGMTFADFDAYWAGPHAEIARGFPRLARYNQNSVRRTALGGQHALDGIVELWFDNVDAMAETLGSPVAKRLPEDEPNFLSGITILSVREEILRDDDGATKLMVVIDFPDEHRASLKLWTEALIGNEAAISRLVLNHVERAGARRHLKSQPNPPAAILEIGGDNTDVLEAALTVTLPRLGADRVSAYVVTERRIV